MVRRTLTRIFPAVEVLRLLGKPVRVRLMGKERMESMKPDNGLIRSNLLWTDIPMGGGGTEETRTRNDE